MFSYLEDNQQGCQRVSDLMHVKDNTTFIAYVNQAQLRNSKYGSKENPVPAWGKDLLQYNGKWPNGDMSDIEREAKIFHISAETNSIFIQQYLSRFMPKEEYKMMFNK
ncbi:hypothetical protein [Chryseobacterium jejuense]|uniref:hypothetical protein n=1 Tax=Chryseobacterium jejuense TaxID=445960 RepID=UPI001AE8A05B|nr:hypothetical protein [Chryseobacterium jejuense]MBP2619648.1 hypothetical protein [Chryseobacterium jejuense]